jgi:outer membrane protein assembly factor BamB
MKRFRTLFPSRWLSRVVSVLLLGASSLLASDWPTYRHDNQRSGVTADALPMPLKQGWALKLAHVPTPAWEAPRAVPVEGILELGRVQFDDAYQPVAAGGMVYLATSADHRVCAIDAASGGIRWQRFVGGPVRLAPVIWEEGVYVTADDGTAYCFDAATGQTRWQRQLAPRTERLLGNGRIVSRWPCRTGILIEGDTAYTSIGIWPSEGVYIEALNPKTGKTIWRNERLGESTDTYISPQGYLLTTGDLLFVPQGRVSPAAFSRQTGKHLFIQRFGKNVGGTWALIADDTLYTGTEELMAYNTKSRSRFAWFKGRQLVVTKGRHYTADGKQLTAVQTDTYGKASLEHFRLRDLRARQQHDASVAKRTLRTATDKVHAEEKKLAALEAELAALAPDAPERAAKQAELARQKAAGAAAQRALDGASAAAKAATDSLEETERRWQAADQGMEKGTGWQTPCAAAEALILAGDLLIAGGVDEVVAVRSTDGERVWQAKVDGKAKGLAVADDKLIVSTDKGILYTFAAAAAANAVQAEPVDSPSVAPATQDLGNWLADQAKLGERPGFAMVLGLADGQLLAALAKATKLTIYGIDPDAKKVARLRQVLGKAGLYGDRICLNVGDPADTHFPNYFADLVASETAQTEGLAGLSLDEAWRLTRPYGGVLLLGSSDSARAAGVRQAAQDERAELLQENGLWLKGRRGALPGAGGWTHQYADAGNTACGYDTRVKCPLRLLWYGQPGPLGMISRHQRAAAPLAAQGVLFVQCEDWVEAYDAYNGVQLWRRSFPKVVRRTVSHDCSNLAADTDSFYVAYRNVCHRLDARSGETLATFAVPEGLGGAWGWVARLDGLLLGSSRSGGRSANAVFAYDVANQELLWTHKARNVLHPALSAGDGQVFLVDDSVDVEKRREALQKRLRGLEPAYAEKILKEAPVRTVVSLDAATGQPRWQRPLDVTGGVGGLYWSSLGTMYRKGALVVFGIYTDGHYWRDFFAGQFESRRIVVLNANDGSDLWEKQIGYRVRPLIIDDTLHAEPWAYDLHTGVQKQRRNPITGNDEPWQFARPGHHCGCPVGSVNCLFFRSYHIGYYDLVQDGGTVHFSTQRAGCWVNFIPGNGLLSVPEASSGCMCPFANMATVVFEPGTEDRAWTKFSLEGAATPVRELCLNLGGPGDRKDRDGRLWLAYPRPRGSLVLPLDVKLANYGGGGAFRQGTDFVKVDNTPEPWLYASGYRGMRTLTVPVMAPGDGEAAYTVRLHFAETEGAKPGQRQFGVKLQGQDVAKDLDIVQLAGGAERALVREFKNVEAAETVHLELVAAGNQPASEQMPLLQAVEIVRERVLRVGLIAEAPPLLNRKRPAGKATIRITNHKPTVFAGALRLLPPTGMRAEPATRDVRVASGQRVEIEVSITADPAKLARGVVRIPVELSQTDGTAEARTSLAVEYLGDRDRTVVSAAEDTYVGPSFGLNRGSNGSILIDGGDRKIGDSSHHVAYLRFRLGQTAPAQCREPQLGWRAHPCGPRGLGSCQAELPNAPDVGRTSGGHQGGSLAGGPGDPALGATSGQEGTASGHRGRQLRRHGLPDPRIRRPSRTAHRVHGVAVRTGPGRPASACPRQAAQSSVLPPSGATARCARTCRRGNGASRPSPADRVCRRPDPWACASRRGRSSCSPGSARPRPLDCRTRSRSRNGSPLPGPLPPLRTSGTSPAGRRRPAPPWEERASCGRRSQPGPCPRRPPPEQLF